MNDRERILSTIASRLTVTMQLDRRIGLGPYADFQGNLGAQFVGTYLVKPKRGDIVRCDTQRGEEWRFARFLEDCNGTNGGYWLLQEIGGPRTVRMGNESLSVLIGIAHEEICEGHERRIYEMARKAFADRYNPKAEYLIRCGGVEVSGDNLKIWVRPHIWGMQKQVAGKTSYALPYAIDLKWSKATRLKDIVSGLIAAGFPREWEWSEVEPGEGMGGCVRLTKDSLTAAIGAMQ